MDGVSMGMGIAVGFAIGIAAGMESGRGDYRKKLQRLLESGEIRMQNASGQAVSLAGLDQIMKKKRGK